MRRFGLLLAICFGFIALIAPTRPALAATAASRDAAANAQIQQIIALVNQRRAEAGLAPVKVNATLTSCAQSYSEVQASQGAINHTGPDGSNPGQRLKRCGYAWKHSGENLAAGYVDANEVMTAWMNSPGHRKNIMNGKLKEIGIGFAHRDNDPGQYYDYYVMELGTRK
jgi:uncharacterized protein YkwD